MLYTIMILLVLIGTALCFRKSVAGRVIFISMAWLVLFVQLLSASADTVTIASPPQVSEGVQGIVHTAKVVALYALGIGMLLVFIRMIYTVLTAEAKPPSASRPPYLLVLLILLFLFAVVSQASAHGRWAEAELENGKGAAVWYIPEGNITNFYLQIVCYEKKPLVVVGARPHKFNGIIADLWDTETIGAFDFAFLDGLPNPLDEKGVPVDTTNVWFIRRKEDIDDFVNRMLNAESVVVGRKTSGVLSLMDLSGFEKASMRTREDCDIRRQE